MCIKILRYDGRKISAYSVFFMLLNKIKWNEDNMTMADFPVWLSQIYYLEFNFEIRKAWRNFSKFDFFFVV